MQSALIIIVFATLVAAAIADSSILRLIDIGEGYVVHDVPMPWAQAKSFCDSQTGKQLVSIETVEEDKLITRLLRNPETQNLPLWTSGRNGVGGSNYVWGWDNSEPLFHSRWLITYPRTAGIFCLVLTSNSFHRSWSSQDCQSNFYPLCESLK